jgi:hypothetical protein
MTENMTLLSMIPHKDPHHPLSIPSALVGSSGTCTSLEEQWLQGWEINLISRAISKMVTTLMGSFIIIILIRLSTY